MAARRVRWLLIVLALHAAIAANAARTVARHSGDFDRFWDISQRTGLPYRDCAVEYPPGTVALLGLARFVAPRRGSFRNLLIGSELLADVAIVAVLVWGWGAMAALYYGVAVIPIITLLFFRVDLWSVALATTAAAAWQRDRLRAAAVAAAAGAVVKLWPLPFAVLLLTREPRRTRRAVALFVVLAAVSLTAWWMIAGQSGVTQVFTFRSAQGWHVETIVGSLLRLSDPAAVRLESGAMRIGSISQATSVTMLALGTALAVVALWIGGTRDVLGAGWLAGVTGLLLLSPLLSPQFLGWLLPAAGIAWVQGHRRSAGLVVVAVLVTILYRIDGWAPGVVARNAVLIAVECSAIADLLTSAGPTGSAAAMR